MMDACRNYIWNVIIRWRPEMRRRQDMTESSSTGSGGSLPSFGPDGLPVYRVILCPKMIGLNGY